MSKFTDEEIYEEALTFGKYSFLKIYFKYLFIVIAGHETTSNLMIWTLYNLANNPDVVHRLESEVDSVLNDNEEITASTLSLLTYTESVLKESLRLHQPVPSVVRKAIEDNILTASDGKKIHVKKGTDIMVNLFTLHQ
jgi:cytochrome P450